MRPRRHLRPTLSPARRREAHCAEFGTKLEMDAEVALALTLDSTGRPMTHAYDALMDSLAALAVAAVHSPVTAVQAYWLALVAQQHSAALP